jgi:hypothetical protein
MIKMTKMKELVLKKLALIVFSLFVCNHTFGQDGEKYPELVKEAYNLYKSKEYLKSGQKYSEAFATFGGKGYIPDRYNAACAWTLANEIDSAFVILFKISESGYYTNIEHITVDTDLYALHEDERWNKVLEIVRSNKQKNEANYDRLLIAILDTIYQDDQKYRKELDKVQTSEERKELWKIIHEKDAINLIKVKKILDERGWLGADIVGVQGNSALFLVIQHSDPETQREYLPMMREAVKNGNARASGLALLEDRVALGKGEKQIYGSQVAGSSESGYVVQPLIDPDNVDKRRAEVGLGLLQDYVSRWGIIWDVEEFKKKQQENEKK